MEINIGKLPEGQQDPQQLFTESRVEEQAFATHLPKTGFIHEYMEYTSIHEAPGSFHFWTAMSVLSAVVQRRAWLSKGIYRVYPNLYVILVAPTGRCRKTGCIKVGIELAGKIDYLNIIADKTTPEALLEALMQSKVQVEDDEDLLTPGMAPSNGGKTLSLDSTGFIRSTEMSTFLNKSNYTSGMITLLTDLYDCPDDFTYLTRTQKPIVLDNIFINMLAGTTPEWLATNLPESAFEGGFMSRVIWVVKHWKDRVIPLEDEPDPAKMKRLVQMLNYIHSHQHGPMVFSDQAKQWYINWYTNNSMQVSDSEKLSGFHERLPDTMLKVAMLLQAADKPGVMQLELSYIKQAEKIIRWSMDKMFRAFEATDLSRIGQLRRQLNGILDHYGEISQREVMRKVAGRLDYKDQFDQVRDIMIEAGELVVQKAKPKGGKGRPKIIWRRPLQSEL